MNDVGELGAGEPHAQFDGRALETGRPGRPLRVPGRCAEKRHHDGLVGTQPTDQPLPRQRSTLLTHICGEGRSGQFWLKRITIKKRMRAKLKEVYDQLKRGRHRPIPEQGRWLASVVRGHFAYYAVPGNIRAINAFRRQVTRLQDSWATLIIDLGVRPESRADQGVLTL